MKIICTADEEEWIKNLMIESNGCALKCQCRLNDMAVAKKVCRQCIEENVEFERGGRRMLAVREINIPKMAEDK